MGDGAMGGVDLHGREPEAHDIRSDPTLLDSTRLEPATVPLNAQQTISHLFLRKNNLHVRTRWSPSESIRPPRADGLHAGR